METKTIRKMFLGFINIHILHHAKKEPIYGTWMIEKLARHGYDLSAGTLYPILHSLEKDGLLLHRPQLINGKIRKYYTITENGKIVLEEARKQAYELFGEVK